MSEILVNTRRTNRPKRVPVHEQGDKLTVQDQDPNFVYRWVNDVDSGQRIAKFKKGGYEVVEDNVTVGDPVVDDAVSKTDTVTEKVVNGSGTRAVLMRIPKEWYEEDQKAKHAKVDASEAAMRQDSLSKYGEIRNAKVDISSTRGR